MGKRCIICRKSDTKTIFKESGIDILKCKNCGHVFSSYEAEQDYGGYFGGKIDSADHFWWKEAHSKMYDDFCKRFIANKSGRLLDVGCGLGYFVKKISVFPNWKVYGYEISKSAAEFAKNKLNLKNIYCGKVEEANFSGKSFNIITMWDVIEHLPDPNPILKYANLILKDEGFLFIHTPNIIIQLPKVKLKKLIKGMRPDLHYLEARDHINIYSPGAIKTILNKNGFRKIKFVHLHPIQSVTGSKSPLLKAVKNLWFYLAKLLNAVSFGEINIDNLFIVARKRFKIKK